jgi:hypothetical protein
MRSVAVPSGLDSRLEGREPRRCPPAIAGEPKQDRTFRPAVADHGFNRVRYVRSGQ